MMAKGQGTPAMQARTAAVRMLIEAHQEEFDRILGDCREAKGLPRDPDAAKREAKIAKLRAQLAALENGDS